MNLNDQHLKHQLKCLPTTTDIPNLPYVHAADMELSKSNFIASKMQGILGFGGEDLSSTQDHILQLQILNKGKPRYAKKHGINASSIDDVLGVMKQSEIKKILENLPRTFPQRVDIAWQHLMNESALLRQNRVRQKTSVGVNDADFQLGSTTAVSFLMPAFEKHTFDLTRSKMNADDALFLPGQMNLGSLATVMTVVPNYSFTSYGNEHLLQPAGGPRAVQYQAPAQISQLTLADGSKVWDLSDLNIVPARPQCDNDKTGFALWKRKLQNRSDYVNGYWLAEVQGFWMKDMLLPELCCNKVKLSPWNSAS